MADRKEAKPKYDERRVAGLTTVIARMTVATVEMVRVKADQPTRRSRVFAVLRMAGVRELQSCQHDYGSDDSALAFLRNLDKGPERCD